MIIVADSSPLISLAIIDKLNVLEKLFTDIYIPQAVYEEIISWNKPFSKTLKVFTEAKVKTVKNRLAVDMLQNDLDPGEAEAIILALEYNIKDILIDEHKGRKIAGLNGLYPIGTVGVLLQSKNNGYITAIKPYLDKLISNRIRISKDLYMKALQIAGE